MKFNNETFKLELHKIYGDSLTLLSSYNGMNSVVLISNKFGSISVLAASLLKFVPGIKSALNKTDYFMNMLNEKYPNIHNRIQPISEYSGMNSKMLFKDKFGIISLYPSNLIQGHYPSIRSAIDKNLYFESMLLYLYNNKYKFIINDSNRHGKKSFLICKTHGKVQFDNDYIFNGSGCPYCSVKRKSNLLYVVRLHNEFESFYKLGISCRDKSNKVIRYKSYRMLGYNVETIIEMVFNNPDDTKFLELKLKRMIKNVLYNPANWDYETSTECFNEDYLELILNEITSENNL